MLGDRNVKSSNILPENDFIKHFFSLRRHAGLKKSCFECTLYIDMIHRQQKIKRYYYAFYGNPQ